MQVQQQKKRKCIKMFNFKELVRENPPKLDDVIDDVTPHTY